MKQAADQIIQDEHRSVSAVLRSLTMLLDQGPGVEPERFFDVARAMLFYIDEFPERQHHPKESSLLFPPLVLADPQLCATIEALERDHVQGQQRVRTLQHLLLAWELLGESRRAEFEKAAREYVHFYLEHMQVEETQVLPAARRLLTPAQWEALDAAFLAHRDPLTRGPHDPRYDRLFTRIVLTAPAPIGVGKPLSAVLEGF